MEKILKYIDPIINYTLSIDNIFSIAQANGPGLDYIIYENFINVTFDDFFAERQFVNFNSFLDWRLYANGISYMKIPKELLKNNTKDTIIDLLNKDYYLYINFDSYYIQPDIFYHNKHQRHDMFIYGYNTDKSTLYTKAYFDYSYPSLCTLSIDEVCDAILLYDNNIAKNYLGLTGFKVNDNGKRNINILLIYKELKEFLSTKKMFNLSKITYNNIINKKIYGLTRLYGISFFDFIIDNLYNANYNEELSLRTYQFIYVHIFLMIQRIKKIKEIYSDYNLENTLIELENLLKKSILVRNLVIKNNIKYNINKGNDLLIVNKILNNVEEIFFVYENIINKIILSIEELLEHDWKEKLHIYNIMGCIPDYM